MKVLIVVDMQNDFISGSLKNPDAKCIIGNVVNKVKNFDGEIFFTKDTHNEGYLRTQEGRNLPVKHCEFMTPGWEIINELKPYVKEGHEIWKDTFGCADIGKKIKLLNDKNKITSIEICGVCTDICVISNALIIKAFNSEIPIIVDAKCCAGSSPEKHAAALETMKSCQIKVI